MTGRRRGETSSQALGILQVMSSANHASADPSWCSWEVNMKTAASVLFAVTLIANMSFGSEPPDAKTRPNVLFIAVDDLRPELTSFGAAGT